ncbi:hypothetical protein [Ferruginibacter sp.]|nr:hypothetical protein [Ferruginibacter sp.]
MARKFIWKSPLLEKGDKLFRSDCSDMRNNAILDYEESHRFAVYNLGYFDAAELLVMSYIKEERAKDLLVYPIIYLYRHSIELKLKEFIWSLNYCLNQNTNFPTNHDLKNLWVEFIKLYSKKDSKNILKKSFTDAAIIIKQLSDGDSFSMAYRYPLDKKGNLSKKPTLLNVRNFALLMLKLKRFLDAISEKINNYKFTASESYADGIYA